MRFHKTVKSGFFDDFVRNRATAYRVYTSSEVSCKSENVQSHLKGGFFDDFSGSEDAVPGRTAIELPGKSAEKTPLPRKDVLPARLHRKGQ